MGDPVKDTEGYKKCKQELIDFGFTEDSIKDRGLDFIVSNGISLMILKKLNKS